MFKSFVNKNCLSMLCSANSRSHLWPQCWRARQQWEQSWCCLNCQPVRKQKLITDSLKERTINRYSSLLSIRFREHTTTISFWKIRILWLLRTTLKSYLYAKVWCSSYHLFIFKDTINSSRSQWNELLYFIYLVKVCVCCQLLCFKIYRHDTAWLVGPVFKM